MFKSQIGKTIEVYIYDMVVKSKLLNQHLLDLAETFGVLKEHKLYLNTSKCAFRVESWKFLRHMITHRGIEVNLNPITTIKRLHPLKNPKEVQCVTGMTVVLNKLISKSIDRC